MSSVELTSHSRQKLIDCDPCLGNQTAQCTACHVWMIGDRKSRLVPNPGKYDVAAFLPRDPPTQALETANDVAGPQQRYWGHQTWTSISRMGRVNGKPCSLRTARHCRMASARFASASASDAPWLMHPGIEAHSAM